MEQEKVSELKNLYPLLRQDDEQTRKEIINGNWRDRLAGRGMNQRSYNKFVKALGYHCLTTLNHPLWLLTQDKRAFITSPGNIIRSLPTQIQKYLVKGRISRHATFKDFSAVAKQSYKQQRSAFFNLHNIDGYTALIITSLVQRIIWKKRDTEHSKNLIDNLFEELFVERFPLQKRNILAYKNALFLNQNLDDKIS
tara:strand:- start:9456 stop:10043 length:588 start_codon:yes stop_codon:yes gene_type:complete